MKIHSTAVIHPRVSISQDVHVGAGTIIGSQESDQYGVIIKPGAIIGENVRIYPGEQRATLIGTQAIIGDDVTIGGGSSIPEFYMVPDNTHIPDNTIING